MFSIYAHAQKALLEKSSNMVLFYEFDKDCGLQDDSGTAGAGWQTGSRHTGSHGELGSH